MGGHMHAGHRERLKKRFLRDGLRGLSRIKSSNCCCFTVFRAETQTRLRMSLSTRLATFPECLKPLMTNCSK